MRRLLMALAVLALLVTACSDDSDSSDGDSTTTAAEVDDDPGAGDLPDDDADEDTQPDDDGAANNAGGPPPADQLRLGGNGTVVVTVDCIDPAPTGVVIFEIEDGESGAVLDIAVNDSPSQLAVGDDGTGRQGVQTEVPDPSTVTVDFGDTQQAGQLIGC